MRYKLKIGASILTSVAILIGGFLLAVGNNVRAEILSSSLDSDLIVTVDSVLALTIAGCNSTNPNDVELEVSMRAEGSFSSCPSTVTVSTNAPGFKLSMQGIDTATYNVNSPSESPSNTPNPYFDGADDTNLNLVRTHLQANPTPPPIAIEIVDTTHTISPHTGTIISPTAITDPNTSYWGFAIPKEQNTTNDAIGLLPSGFDSTYSTQNDTGSTNPSTIGLYAKVPTNLTQIKDYPDFNNTPNQTTIFYGTRVTAKQKAGTYKGIVQYTVIGEEEPDIPGLPYLQTFTQQDCATLSVYTNDNDDDKLLTLIDKRDGQEYLVGKLADERCWMLNNLKLGSMDGPILLSPTDTNITIEWSLPMIDNTIVGYDFDTPRVFSYWDDDGPSGGNNPSMNEDITSDTFYGYHYNWCAATAGGTDSGGSDTCQPSFSWAPTDATGDICPLNWRMPTASSDASVNEFSILNASMDAGELTTGSNGNYWQSWQHSGPFRGVFAGYHVFNTWFNQNTNSFISSSSIDPSNPMGDAILYLNFSPWSVDIGSGGKDGDRHSALSVRCLLK